MTRRLDKPTYCAKCGAAMTIGDSFEWHKTTKAAIGPRVGGSYTLAERTIFRPRHSFDCIAQKMAAESRAMAERIAAYARDHGATQSEIDAILKA